MINSRNNKWSDKLIKNYQDYLDDFQVLIDEVFYWLEQAKNGAAFNNDSKNHPLPTPATPPNLKKYIADIYDIESADIDLMISF